MKLFIKIIGIFYLLSFTSLYANNDECQPQDLIINKSNLNNEIDQNTATDSSVFIYFDQSLSMQGYTKDQSGQKNLYINVIDDLQQIAENVGNKTYYHSFGKSILPIQENKISQVIKPIFYECTGSAQDCNN